jgi:hypothetical protein
VRTFRRYVAIGDSSTEGLADPDGESGYRGWADRLAEIIANAQAEPLDYANLGVRSAHLSEIRTTQFDAAMAMQPDLFSIFGGANDMLSVTCDFAGIRADLAAIFGEARSRDCTVVTFYHARSVLDRPLRRAIPQSDVPFQRHHQRGGRAVRRASHGLPALPDHPGPPPVLRGPVARQRTWPRARRGRDGLAARYRGLRRVVGRTIP